MKQTLRLLPVLLACSLLSCSGGPEEVDWSAGVKDIPDLAGKRISVFSGSLDDLVASELEPEAEILRLSSIAEVLAAVSNGQADYCILDSLSLIGVDLEEKGLMYLFSSDIVSGDMGFAFRYGEEELHSEFNDFLARYKADGRWRELNARWTTGDVASVVMPEIEMDPEGETLRVGTISNFPFSFIQNGEYAGFEVELIETFAAETGRNVQFQMIDFSGMIAALVTGKIDVSCCTMTITEERSKQVLFSDSYYFCNTAGCCRSVSGKKESKPFFAAARDSFHNNLIVEDRWKIVLMGLWETLVISLMSILLGSVFGAFICWMKLSGNKVLKGIAGVYVDIIRGVPILVLLMLMFYVIFSSSGVSARWVAIIAFAMNFGAYVSEMFRTGIEGVDRGQTEAGLAMGFTPVKTFTFFIVPQALKKVAPVFKGEAVSLIKNTSVVGFIAIQDLTKASEIIRARTFDAFFPLILISIIYFILAWILGKALDRLANKIA